MAVTFVCDLCGASGLAPGPGSAQCATCGNVALVSARRSAAPERDVLPSLLASPPSARADDEVDLVLDREVEEQSPRLAELWTRPETRELPTPVPGSLPVRRAARASAARPLRGLGRTAGLAATFVAGAAFALGAVVAVRGGWASGAPDPAARGEVDVPTRRGSGEERVSPGLLPLASAAGSATTEPRDAPAPVVRAGRAEPVPRAAPPPAAARPARTAAATVPAAATRTTEDLLASRATGFLDPAPEDRQCVPRALRALRRDQPGRFPEEITVRFPVAASGAVGRIDVSGSFADRGAADAIREAVRGCPFRPGADAAGRPTAAAVVMRIRFPAR